MTKEDLYEAIDLIWEIAEPRFNPEMCKECPARIKCRQRGFCSLQNLIEFRNGTAIIAPEGEKLKQCPFCGHEKIIFSSKDYGESYSLWIECEGCGCRTPSKTLSREEIEACMLCKPLGIKAEKVKKSLIDKWNRREGSNP